jgi:hypothetical protein
MDITETLAPKSDQMDAVDLLGGPRTFTIVEVTKGSSDEQPIQVKLAEFPRPWRPSKGMRRVLAACWSPHANTWTGRRLTLFCDPTVKFGGAEVGGIRVSHVSDLPGPKKVPVLITKGKSAMYTVQPLKEDGPRGLSQAQSKRIGTLLRENDLTDKDLVLALYTDAIGREVAATKDLTVSEADQVIAALERMATEPSVEQPPEQAAGSSTPGPAAAQPADEDPDPEINSHWAPQDPEPAP